eukprot:7380051-Prymnesium_polylepis.1
MSSYFGTNLLRSTVAFHMVSACIPRLPVCVNGLRGRGTLITCCGDESRESLCANGLRGHACHVRVPRPRSPLTRARTWPTRVRDAPERHRSGGPTLCVCPRPFIGAGTAKAAKSTMRIDRSDVAALHSIFLASVDEH